MNIAAGSPIVVGIDGSEQASHALAWACHEALLRAAPVKIVHVWQLPFATVGSGLLTDEVSVEVEQGAKIILDQAIREASTTGVEDIRSELAFGQPITTLMAACRGAQLLVLGTRGRGQFLGIFLGSVSQYLSVHAPCPVVVVHGGDTDGFAESADAEEAGAEAEEEAPASTSTGTGAEERLSPLELTEIEREECLALLGSKQVGRLAVERDGRPQIFTVNYALDGEILAFRTGPGIKLDWATLAHVAFEVDDIDESIHQGWVVEVQGIARDLTAATDAHSEHIKSLPIEPWVPGSALNWVAIIEPTFTGRRLGMAPPATP